MRGEGGVAILSTLVDGQKFYLCVRYIHQAFSNLVCSTELVIENYSAAKVLTSYKIIKLKELLFMQIESPK